MGLAMAGLPGSGQLQCFAVMGRLLKIAFEFI
jgi:hypothetical protein